MKPFTRQLHIESAQFTHNPNARHLLSQTAKTEVWMWRAFVLILQAPGIRLHRPIESFRSSPPTFELHYDASLSQIAVGVYVNPGPDRVLKCFAAPMLPFPVSSDSSRQNTCEYIAVLLGLLLAAYLDISDASYTLFGDSISSLAWSRSGKAASSLATRANLGVTVVAVNMNYDVAYTVHVPGVLNDVYDGLSRGRTAEDVGLPPELQLHLPPSHPMIHYLKLCDPALALPTAFDHVRTLEEFAALLRTFACTHT